MLPRSNSTFFSEVQAIDLTLKLVDLLGLLHSRNVVHTNLCPKDIFLKEKKLNQMQFLNLFHSAKDAEGDIGFKYIKNEIIGISKFDIRARCLNYISPEQIELGQMLKECAEQINGKMDPENPRIKHLIHS